MKNLFILFAFFLTCSNKKEKINSLPVVSIKQIPTFSCNYSLSKLRSKQLYHQFKTESTDSNRYHLVIFLRDSLLPCWYGTEWNFYGTTQEPGKGSIACGYFVTTVLRDIGFSLNRIKLAQCASEEMIKSVCTKSSIQRFRNVAIQEFVDKIRKYKPGLYIVGLDNHTGFILVDGSEIYFIHSTYVGRKAVQKEKAIDSWVLAASKYKVIGEVRL